MVIQRNKIFYSNLEDVVLELQQTAPKIISGSMLISEDQKLKELLEFQKKKDLEDIENLWKGTVENNKVIEFTLKKLATNP